MAKQMSATHALAIAQRAHSRDLRRKHRIRSFECALVRKATVSISAAGLGALKRHGVTDEVAGVPWKLPLWLLATLGEALSGSATLTSFFAGVSDTTMAVYMANAIGNKTFVAGDGGEL